MRENLWCNDEHEKRNKRKFVKRRWAKEWIKKNQQFCERKLSVYKCTICGHFHLTTKRRFGR